MSTTNPTVVTPKAAAAVAVVAVAVSPHPTWNDDERSSTSSTVYRQGKTECGPSRPLWKDVLWGRECGHELLFDGWIDEVPVDTSHYVDFEFDSGCGSPTTDRLESLFPWNDIEDSVDTSIPDA